MLQAGAAVADRCAFLRVQGGPSGPHFPPAAYRFIYDSPGLGAPHQPPRGGPRGHRVVGGIPAKLKRAGFLPAAARRRGGTRVCYRPERSGAWRGVRSEMALRGVPPPPPTPSALIISMSWSCLPWRSPSIAGARNGMTHRFSCTRTTCRWCRFGRRCTCKCPHIMSRALRLFFFLAQRNVNLLLAHMPGCQNINADMLSRLQMEEFRSKAFGTLPIPTMVPSHVWGWL